jgi:pyruvate dehydrogenase E1 component alpha subunit
MGFGPDLGDLVDPRRYTGALDMAGCDPAVLREQLRTMLRIRIVEEHIAQLVESGEARCPCHLGIGQEAIPVGVSAHLNAGDRVFGNHRSHPHYLALGGDGYGLLAEVLGKDSGCSRGMGGSMHLVAAEQGFCGSVPIVGATIPIAVGAGLAAKLDGRGQIAVCYFGDGAAEEGVLHESLNLAAVFRLPVLFVCENNLFSSHLDIRLRQPSDRISRFADAHHVAAAVVDGNDLVAVTRVAGELIAETRQGRPAFLEAVTYRWRGHVGPKEDVDVGLRRKAGDLAAWKRRDPVRRLAEALQAAGELSPHGFDAMQAELHRQVSAWCDQARAAPYPPSEALLERVYAAS